MKIKKSLLMVTTLFTMCACSSGDSGLVSGGEKYSTGTNVQVDEAKKQEVASQIKGVKIVEDVKQTQTVKDPNGKKQSASASDKITLVYDFDEKSLTYTSKSYKDPFVFKQVTSGSGETEYVVVYQGNEYPATQFGLQIDYEALFDIGFQSVFSWNFVTDSETVQQQLDSSVAAIQSMLSSYGAVDFDDSVIRNYVNDYLNSMVIKGDVPAGNFEVGLSKAVSMDCSFIFSISGMNIALDTKLETNKQKSVFKDYLMTKSYTANKQHISMNYEGQTGVIDLITDATCTYSYIKR